MFDRFVKIVVSAATTSVLTPGSMSIVRGSFVPPRVIRELRDPTRYRKRLVQAHTNLQPGAVGNPSGVAHIGLPAAQDAPAAGDADQPLAGIYVLGRVGPRRVISSLDSGLLAHCSSGIICLLYNVRLTAADDCDFLNSFVVVENSGAWSTEMC